MVVEGGRIPKKKGSGRDLCPYLAAGSVCLKMLGTFSSWSTTFLLDSAGEDPSWTVTNLLLVLGQDRHVHT